MKKSCPHKTYVTIAGIVFLIAFVLHLIRSIAGWQLVLGPYNIPMWISWLAVIITAVLVFYSFKFAAEK